MQEVTNLRHVSIDDIKDVGEKAASLGTLSKGYNVASGYVLSKSVFEGFIEENQFRSKIRNFLAIADANDEHRLSDVADEIQKLILSGRLNKEIEENIIEAYYSLNIDEDAPLQKLVDADKEPLVVVRPSPTYPSKEKSLISLLHVKGKDKLIKSIIACFASLFTAEAIKERSIKGQRDVGIAVIIQIMIIPHISGYIYNEDDDIIINACYGLSDETTEFDRYAVSQKLELTTVSAARQKQAFMQDPETEKLAKIELPEIKASNQKMNDKQILALARLYKKTDMKDKKIEYIIDKQNYYFVQVLNMEKKPLDKKEIEIPKNIADSPDEPEKVVVDLEEKGQAGPVIKEPEPVKEGEGAKENTLFALFKTNKGDKPPEIPTVPVEERKPKQEMSQPENTKIVEDGPKAIITDEDDDIGMEEQLEVYDEPEDAEEMDDAQEDQEEGGKFEDEELKAETEPATKTKPGLHPLNREEWFETLRMEHTKIIISYDLVILNALRSKYSQLFKEEAQSFEEMIDKLSTKEKVPYVNEIKKIRRLRNDFLKSHKPISIEELKESYEATVLFLREFL